MSRPSKSSFVMLDRFLDIELASVPLSRLRAAGIDAHLQNTALNTVLPSHNIAVSGVRLVVPAYEEAKAREILSEDAYDFDIEDLVLEEHEASALVCPDCGAKLDPSNLSRTTGSILATALVAIISIVGSFLISPMFLLGLVIFVRRDNKYSCRFCGGTVEVDRL